MSGWAPLCANFSNGFVSENPAESRCSFDGFIPKVPSLERHIEVTDDPQSR